MMKHAPSHGHRWTPTDHHGVEIALLDAHPGGGVTLLTRFAAGVRGGRHNHPGGEELYILSGRCTLDDLTLAPGDFVATPPGASHELVALEETVVLVRLPVLPVYES